MFKVNNNIPPDDDRGYIYGGWFSDVFRGVKKWRFDVVLVIFIVNFEHISHLFPVFLLST